MKKLIVLLKLLFCLSLSATEYIGTLQMASGYTLKDVRVCLDEQGNLTLYHVKFARMMPMTATATRIHMLKMTSAHPRNLAPLKRSSRGWMASTMSFGAEPNRRLSYTNATAA